MTMREHLKAIEIAARKMMPGEPCGESECFACAEDRAVLAAISAALAAADEREREFEMAAVAWRAFRDFPQAGTMAELDLDAYFNPAKEGW